MSDITSYLSELAESDPLRKALIEAVTFWYQVTPDLPYKVYKDMVVRWKKLLGI